MTELIDTLREIPLAAIVPLAIALIVGLLLWSMGRKVLRPGFTALGLLFGLMLGYLAGDAWNLGLPAWGVAVIAGLVLAAAALVLYRVALAGTMAAIFAIACPMAAVAIYELRGNDAFIAREVQQDAPDGDDAAEESAEEEDDPWWDKSPRDHLEDHVQDYVPQFGDDAEVRPLELDEDNGSGREEAPTELDKQIATFRSFGERLLEGFRDAWDSTAPTLQPILLGAAVGGMIFGFVLGAVLPTFSASIVTAFGGSLLWLGAVRVMAERLNLGDLGVLPATGKGWLAFWIIASLIGLAIQWMFRGRPADKSG